MKKMFKSSKNALVVCTLFIALVIASCFSVPYVLAYFSVTQDLLGNGTTPVFKFIPTYTNATLTTVNMAGNTDTMYVSNSGISQGLNDMELSITPSQVTANCLLRVMISIQLSTNNTVTEQTIKPLDEKLLFLIDDTNWQLAGSTSQTNIASNYINCYLYYKQVVSANITTPINVNTAFGVYDASLDGLYIVSNAYVEAVEASKNGAQKWLNGTIGSLSGWEQTWYAGLGTLA